MCDYRSMELPPDQTVHAHIAFIPSSMVNARWHAIRAVSPNCLRPRVFLWHWSHSNWKYNLPSWTCAKTTRLNSKPSLLFIPTWFRLLPLLQVPSSTQFNCLLIPSQLRPKLRSYASVLTAFHYHNRAPPLAPTGSNTFYHSSSKQSFSRVCI